MAKIVGFSEAGYIALHCMMLMAKNRERLLSVKEMASALKVSEAHLAKVMLWLAKAELINTTRGPKGGATLAREAQDISFLEIIEAIDGPVRSPDCVFGHSECVYKECIFGDFISHMTDEAAKWLAEKRLA